MATVVMLGWYAAIVGFFMAVLRSLDDTFPQDCTGFCGSDRGQMGLIGVFLGLPALTVAFLISGLMLVHTTTRDPRPPAVSAGTAAAIPGFVATVLVMCVSGLYLS